MNKRSSFFSSAMLLGGALLLGQATGAEAQAGVTVRGTVLDGEGLVPVEDVLVELDDGRFQALTDADGSFVLRDVPPGTYAVFVEHLGFERGSDTLRVEPAGELRVEIRMAARAIELDPLNVEVLSREERIDRSRGTVRNRVSRAEIDEMVGRAVHVGDVLQAHVTGISIRESQSAGSRFCLEFRSPVSLLNPMGCHPPTVVVDGVPVFNPLDYLSSVPLGEIESMEVLSAAEAGTRYGGDAAHGVILIQTRRPGVGDVRPPERIRRAYDWDREPGRHPWKRVLVGSALGGALGVGVVLAAAGDCSPLNENRATECVGSASTMAGVAGFSVPVLGAAAGANVLGRTRWSHGDYLRTVALTASPMLLGYFFATPRDGRTVSANQELFGRIVVTVGVPVVATVADRLFRSVAGDGPPNDRF